MKLFVGYNRQKVSTNFLIYFLPVFFIMILFALVINYSQKRADIKVVKSNERVIVTAKLNNIHQEFTNIINDLKILSLSSQLENLWDNYSNEKYLNSLTNDFLNISNHRKSYDQVRLINEYGMELIRINFNINSAIVVPKNKLQSKKNRYYFNDAFILDKNEVYVSPFDLNVEHGEIEQPIKPMIRIATPVFNKEGVKKGVVLFNYLGQNIINQLIVKNKTISSSRLMLVNNEGYWIKGLSSQQEWGFMYDERKDVTFANNFPDAWEVINNEESSQFITKKGLFTFKTVYPLMVGHKSRLDFSNEFIPSNEHLNIIEYNWKIVSYVPSDMLYVKQRQWVFYTILLLVILSFIMIFLAWNLAKAKMESVIAQKRINEINVIIEKSPGVIFLWKNDENWTVEHVTKNVNMIFGYTSNDFTNNRILYSEVIYPEDIQKVQNEAIINNLDKISHKQYRIINKAGDIRWVKDSSTLRKDVVGNTTHYEGIIIDITDQVIAEQKLKNSEANLKESNITKDKFFSIVAHDLKSPFNAMLGLSDMLVNKYDKFNSAKQKKIITEINKSIKNTYKLLENLLLWSRSQRGVIEFNPKNNNTQLLINEAIESLNQSAINKSISIELKIQHNKIINADRNMLSAILRNLVSNAIKFTPKNGNIIIEMSSVNDNEETFTKICVKDNGVGILQKEQLKLFKVSENISTPGTDNETGTGLGLILCKEFVEKHNGKIWIESKVGKGSSFCFTLMNNRGIQLST